MKRTAAIFSYSMVGSIFKARQGGCIGAKIALFGSQPAELAPEDVFDYNSRHLGFADFEWFRVTPVCRE